MVRLRQGRAEDAAAHLSRARELKLAAGDPDALVGAAEELRAMEGREEAVAFYRAALSIRPEDVRILDRFAMLRFEQGRLGAALDLYRALVRLAPVRAQPHVNLGVVLYRLGRRGEAMESIERALELEPTLESALAARRAMSAER